MNDLRTILYTNRHWVINVSLFLFFGVFAYRHLLAYAAVPRMSLLLFVTMESILMILSVIRRKPKTVSQLQSDWMIAIGGTIGSLLLQPIGSGIAPLLGERLITFGAACVVLSYLSLNTGYGTVPANRGIKTRGMYGLVRHPIYVSYIFLYLGYIFMITNTWNVLIFISIIIFIVMRIQREEHHLRHDPEYTAYTLRVPWKLIPYVL